MYPTNNVYIPDFGQVKTEPLTIEQVREHGRIVAIDDKNTVATVEVKIGLQICYCGVTLNKDGTIKDFIERK